MPLSIVLRSDYSSVELRRLAKKSKDNNQARRLLSLAAVVDGMNWITVTVLDCHRNQARCVAGFGDSAQNAYCIPYTD